MHEFAVALHLLNFGLREKSPPRRPSHKSILSQNTFFWPVAGARNGFNRELRRFPAGKICGISGRVGFLRSRFLKICADASFWGNTDRKSYISGVHPLSLIPVKGGTFATQHPNRNFAKNGGQNRNPQKSRDQKIISGRRRGKT